eukprot:Trichotokara_eunicae@DN2365_c0_g1_i1.p1
MQIITPVHSELGVKNDLSPMSPLKMPISEILVKPLGELLESSSLPPTFVEQLFSYEFSLLSGEDEKETFYRVCLACQYYNFNTAERMVHNVGHAQSINYLKASLEIAADGGVPTSDMTRLRNLSGILWWVLRQVLPKKIIDSIFADRAQLHRVARRRRNKGRVRGPAPTSLGSTVGPLRDDHKNAKRRKLPPGVSTKKTGDKTLCSSRFLNNQAGQPRLFMQK